MTFITGDLAYEILARGGHGHGSYHSGGHGDGTGGPMDWWVWVALGISAIVVIVSLIKKFSSN